MHIMMSTMGHCGVLNALSGCLCYCSKSSAEVGDGWLHNEGKLDGQAITQQRPPLPLSILSYFSLSVSLSVCLRLL
jgi:hypothetical protein